MKNSLLFRVWLLLFSVLASCHSYALSHSDFLLDELKQQTQITGTVTVDGMPMTGVMVTVVGQSASAVSGDDGKFAITANPDDTLVFAFVGFRTLTEPLNGRTYIAVALQEDTTALQEVTVNAGYYSVKEKERTGSIAKIKAVDIETQPVSNPLAAMQGRMAGVNITQSTGTPGSGFSIQVRGLNSLRGEGNDPLYIIDGIPYASQSLGSGSLTNGVMPGLPSPLNSINPSDIESIEVLKDADATAIYGSRGANGVVLITTKKGRPGATRFTLSAATTVGAAVSRLDVLNTRQYLEMRAEAFANDGITGYPADAYDINGTWSQTRNTDWKKELIGGTSYVHNLQAAVSGGSAGTQFLVSGTYRVESTVTPDEGKYSKGMLHSSISHRSPDEKFRLDFSADYASDKNTLPAVDLSQYAYSVAPNAPALYDSDGSLNWENGTFENPLAQIQGRYLAVTGNLVSNAVFSYDIGSGFEIKASAGFSDTRLTENKTLPSTRYNPIYNPTSQYSEVLNNNTSRSSWIVEPQLGWRRQFGSAKFDVLAGATFQSQKQQQFSVYAMGFPSEALIQSLTAANTLIILNDETAKYRYNAFFGRVNVNLHDKYILNVTGRRDGSSRFGTGNRFANFGAVGLAWIFSKDAFFSKENSFLSFGKVRGSYGIAGNDQIGDYQYLDTYSVTANQYDGITGLQPTRLFNPDFGWETNRKLEAALELGFLHDRIFLSAAWFRNSSSNQLVGIPLPATAGFPSVQSNLDATVQNTGVELELRTSNVLRNGFKWVTTFNISAVKNKLLEYPGIEGSVYANRFVVGEPITIDKLYHYTGINPTTGTYTFEDANGDGQLTSLDRQVIFDAAPKFYGGLGNNVTYKSWSLDFLFQFVKQKAYSALRYFPAAGLFTNQPADVIDHYPPGSGPGAVQQYTAGNNGEVFFAEDNYIQSDAMIVDASYIRLKSFSVTYLLPTWAKSVSAKVYLQGQNLLTFTKYKGVDPETQSIYYLPALRQFTLGLQLGF